jgi:hypothetical protein
MEKFQSLQPKKEKRRINDVDEDDQELKILTTVLDMRTI